MERLNLPHYEFKIRSLNNKLQIFDTIRKKFVALSPEEWVRQNFIAFLIHEKKYPGSLIAIETGLNYNKQKKRSDILVYGKEGKPFMLIECKASRVEIKSNAFEQLSRYNSTLKVEYGIVTNGMQHYCFKVDFNNKSFEFLNDIPPHHS